MSLAVEKLDGSMAKLTITVPVYKGNHFCIQQAEE